MIISASAYLCSVSVFSLLHCFILLQMCVLKYYPSYSNGQHRNANWREITSERRCWKLCLHHKDHCFLFPPVWGSKTRFVVSATIAAIIVPLFSAIHHFGTSNGTIFNSSIPWERPVWEFSYVLKSTSEYILHDSQFFTYRQREISPDDAVRSLTGWSCPGIFCLVFMQEAHRRVPDFTGLGKKWISLAISLMIIKSATSLTRLNSGIQSWVIHYAWTALFLLLCTRLRSCNALVSGMMDERPPTASSCWDSVTVFNRDPDVLVFKSGTLLPEPLVDQYIAQVGYRLKVI